MSIQGTSGDACASWIFKGRLHQLGANITIKNNTSDTIGYYYSAKTPRRSIYDTLLPEGKPKFDVSYYGYGLKPYSFKTHVIYGSIDYRDLQSYMDAHVLFYYFFNYDSINTLPWSKIREKNIIMKRVIIDTKQDFEKCNFEIVYP